MHTDHITPCIVADIERWLPILDWPDYDVSDWGRVRSYLARGRYVGFHRRRATKETTAAPLKISRTTPRIMKLTPAARGHLRIRLTRWINGQPHSKGFFVHTLVLTTFRGPCPAGMECCHDPDPDPTNNRLTNLRWDTHSGNVRDMVRQGRHSGAVLTADIVCAIWPSLVEGIESDREIADRLGLSIGSVASVRTGDCWSHVTGNLPGIAKFPRRQFYEERAKRVCNLRESGESLGAIAKACGILVPEVCRIIRRNQATSGS